MGLFSIFRKPLDWLDDQFRKLSRVGKKPHADYFNEKEAKYWTKPYLRIFIGERDRKTLADAWERFRPACHGYVDFVLVYNVAERNTCDIDMYVDPETKGRSEAHTNTQGRGIVSAYCKIAIDDPRKQRAAAHEIMHLLGIPYHSDDDRDAAYSPCFVDSPSDADKATIAKIREMRRKAIGY